MFTCHGCSGMGGRAEPGVTLSPEALSFLAACGATPPQRLSSVPLGARVDHELESVHRALMRLHLEKELRSTRVLSDLRR